MSHLIKRGNRYTISFSDHEGRRRRLSTGLSNESWARRWMQGLEDVVECRRARQVMPAHVSHWLDDLPASVLEQLAAWRIIDPRRVWTKVTMTQHIDAWEESLRARELSEEHIRIFVLRVRTAVKATRMHTADELHPGPIERWLAGERAKGMSQSNSNAYVTALKAMSKWLYNEGRTPEHQLRTTQKVRVTEIKRVRRSVSLKEQARLIEAARIGPERFGFTGEERALLYELAMNTGLRKNELLRLTPRHFKDMDTGAPRIYLKASETKNRRPVSIPVRLAIAVRVAERTALMTPTTPVFQIEPRDALAMLREDMAAAGIPNEDDAGRRFDFHALRGQFGTNLARAGVHPAAARDLLRHSDINQTMKHYTHLLHPEQQAAVESIGDIEEQGGADTSSAGGA